MIFDRIRIVLVATTHPGNIGSTARAMKTMGLSSLYLVQPKQFPCAEAIAMAAGADDILENAVVVDTLQQAIAQAYQTHPKLGSAFAGFKATALIDGNIDDDSPFS